MNHTLYQTAPDVQEQLSRYYQTAPKIHFSPAQVPVPVELYRQLDKEVLPDTMMTYPYRNCTDEVYSRYGMPYPLYPYQQAWVDALADRAASGMYFEVGAGKTATATVAALYQRIYHPGHTLVIMPPILIRQWHDWLNKIEGVGTVLMYKGTPTERAGLNLDVDFILMSIDIFKRDFERLYDFYYERNCTLIVDEAVSVKNPATQNHKCVWAFHNRDRSKLVQRTAKVGKVERPKTDAAKKSRASKDAVAKLKIHLKGKFE